MRPITSIFSLLGAILLLSAAPVRADWLRGPYDYPSPIAFNGQIGLQAGLGGYTPGGFKLQLGYDHRFASSRDHALGVWFFATLSGVFGPGVGVCGPGLITRGAPVFECDAVGYGSDIEGQAGVQLTWRTPVPLVPFLRLGAAVAAVLGRDGCHDSGAAVPLATVGGGARYFLTRHFAVALGADLHLGPAFYSSGTACFTGDHNELWRSLSVLAGVQYAL